MNREIRIGIIGCGTIAPIHAMAISATDGAELIGAVSHSYEKAKHFAENYSCEAFKSYEDMLSDRRIDAVSVCTPSGYHFENVRQALNAGKHVIVEKPICLTLEEADELTALSKERALCLCVVSQTRFSAAAQAVKKMIASGVAGKPVSAQLMMRFYRGQEYYDSAGWRGTWKYDGGGILMNQGIHGIDLLCYLMGRPLSVTGYAKTRLRQIEVEDTAAAALEFESGAVGTIDATACSVPSFIRRYIFGFENGTVIMENDTITHWSVPAECPDCTVSLTGNTSADNTKVSAVYHTKQYGNFIRHLLADEPLVIDGTEGRIPLSVILGIYESSHTGRRVSL